MSDPVREPWRPNTTLDRVKLALVVGVVYVGIALLFRATHSWVESLDPIDPRRLQSTVGPLVAVAACVGVLVGWIAGYTPVVLTFRWRVFASMNWLLLMQIDRIRMDRPVVGNLGLVVVLVLGGLFWAWVWTAVEQLTAPTWKVRSKPPSGQA